MCSMMYNETHFGLKGEIGEERGTWLKPEEETMGVRGI
jgi:hypothetical protein